MMLRFSRNWMIATVVKAGTVEQVRQNNELPAPGSLSHDSADKVIASSLDGHAQDVHSVAR